MAKNQRHYTPEFKQQIVDLYNAGGTSYPQLEREYGINRSTLSSWVKQLSPIKVSEDESVTLKEYRALQKEIQRHMAAQGLRSVVVKKYNHHANQGTVPADKENILKRDFQAETINRKWCTDITYIHVLKEGWTYLASVIDLCSRKIIGYAYGTTMTAELAVQAVKNACLNVKDTKGIILHSDLGSQYTSQMFEDYLSKRGLVHSFSRKGNPYDNACIESFHSVLKKEEVYLHIYQDFKEARRAIFEYIESWYNRKRIHSAIDYMTPQQKEDEELKRVA